LSLRDPENEYFVDGFRAQLPILNQWIYLRHYNKGPIPIETHELLSKYLEDQFYTPNLYRDYWFDLSEQARSNLGKLLGVPSSNIAFTQNASEALSILLENFPYRSNCEVVTSLDEYPPYLRAFQSLENKGVNVIIVRSRAEILNAITSKTQFVFLSYISWRDGVRYNFSSILNACQNFGCSIILDVVQSVGCFRIGAELTAVDFMIGNSRKWLLGGEGLGYIYINPKHLTDFSRICDRNASVVEGDGFLDWRLRRLNSHAMKLEPGGRNTSARLALYGSLNFLFSAGVEYIENRVLNLVEYATLGSTQLGLNLLSSSVRQNMSGILAINLSSDLERKHVIDVLKSNKVIATGYGNVLIIALHFFNTKFEIDYTLSLLARS
jgi:cysteine desulfurase/selenocysteine lyase